MSSQKKPLDDLKEAQGEKTRRGRRVEWRGRIGKAPGRGGGDRRRPGVFWGGTRRAVSGGVPGITGQTSQRPRYLGPEIHWGGEKGTGGVDPKSDEGWSGTGTKPMSLDIKLLRTRVDQGEATQAGHPRVTYDIEVETSKQIYQTAENRSDHCYSNPIQSPKRKLLSVSRPIPFLSCFRCAVAPVSSFLFWGNPVHDNISVGWLPI